MDKVKLEFNPPIEKTIEYNGVSIQLIPFLTTTQQVFLINQYMKDYFHQGDLIEKSRYDFLTAEYGLIYYICDLLTNIDMDTFDAEIYSDPAFVNMLFQNISNYEDFRYNLFSVLESMKYQEEIDNSLGKVISNLEEKILDILNKFSDIKPEDLEKAAQEGHKLLDELKESPLIRELSLQEKESK